MAAKKKAAKKAVKKKSVKKAVKKTAAKKPTKRAAAKKPRARKAYAANLKTVVNDASVAQFIANVPDAEQRLDSQTLDAMFANVTGETPRMWGSSIVGYGTYAYVGKSGRAGDWMTAGFSPRKGNLTLYMLGGWEGNKALLNKLGKHSLGKGCLYVSRLSQVDIGVLKSLIVDAYDRALKIKPKMYLNGGAN